MKYKLQILILIFLSTFLISGCTEMKVLEAPPGIVLNNDSDLIVGSISVLENLSTGDFLLLNEAYEDLRFPAEVVKVQGASNIPEYKIFLNNTLGLVFSQSTMNQGFLTAQLPHARKDNTTLYPHFHWAATPKDSGYVTWCMEYTCANINDIFPFTEIKCVNDTHEAAYQHQMTDMIEIPNNLSSSAICNIRIYRDAPADTYNHDVYLLEFDIHYVVDKLGEQGLP